jgi:4'-phosphopantetheinyl transferase EntD
MGRRSRAGRTGAAQQKEPLYSITLSARPSSIRGTVTPSVFAVTMLMTDGVTSSDFRCPRPAGIGKRLMLRYVLKDAAGWRQRGRSCRPTNAAMNATMNATNPALALAIDAMAVPGIVVDHRLIADGDELALLPEEIGAFAGSVTKVRRASGAARIVARQLLPRFGHAPCAIPKFTAGMPVWPEGIVGSLAHDAEVAIAAMAARHDFFGVGVDVEPAEPLDPGLLDIVATATERERAHDEPLHGRLLFSIKEAIYKAVYPLDGTFLDHHDVEVDLAGGTAAVRHGRVVRFRYCVATHIVALAFISAGPELI